MPLDHPRNSTTQTIPTCSTAGTCNDSAQRRRSASCQCYGRDRIVAHARDSGFVSSLMLFAEYPSSRGGLSHRRLRRRDPPGRDVQLPENPPGTLTNVVLQYVQRCGETGMRKLLLALAILLAGTAAMATAQPPA